MLLLYGFVMLSTVEEVFSEAVEIIPFSCFAKSEAALRFISKKSKKANASSAKISAILPIKSKRPAEDSISKSDTVSSDAS